MKTFAKSPLRYPGGKSRAIAQILAQMPARIAEYREPFVGGGSAFLPSNNCLAKILLSIG
jgi:DNA adenine methylase